MKIHIVKRGETLEKIARKYQLSLQQLKEANGHIKDGDKLIAGIKVKVPTASVPLKARNAVPDQKEVNVPATKVSGQSKRSSASEQDRFEAQVQSQTPPPPPAAAVPPMPEMPEMPKMPKMPMMPEMPSYQAPLQYGQPNMMPGYGYQAPQYGAPEMMPGQPMQPQMMSPEMMLGQPMQPQMMSPEMMPGQPMQPQMMSPEMMPSPYTAQSFGMQPQMIPQSPELYPGYVSPQAMPSMPPMPYPPAPCQPCQEAPVPNMPMPEFPSAVSPFGMNPMMMGPASIPPAMSPDCGPQGVYDKKFFTYPHYPTPYHEQLYLNQSVQGVDCEQHYMPPGHPEAVSPYMMQPVQPNMMFPYHHMPPMYPCGPEAWESEESCESYSECSSSSSSRAKKG